MLGAGSVPEVVEADLVEERRRLVARDVPAELGRLLVRAQHHRDRVPADQRADPALERRVAGQLGLVLGVDRVDVRRRADVLDRGAAQPGPLDDPLDEVVRPPGAVVADDGVEGLDPFLGLDRVDVLRWAHREHPMWAMPVLGLGLTTRSGGQGRARVGRDRRRRRARYPDHRLGPRRVGGGARPPRRRLRLSETEVGERSATR